MWTTGADAPHGGFVRPKMSGSGSECVRVDARAKIHSNVATAPMAYCGREWIGAVFCTFFVRRD